MVYEKAAVRHARRARERRLEIEQHRRARIDTVIAEFDGDSARMAQALLDCRHLLRQFIDAGELVREGKLFIVLGPGPYGR